MASKIVFVGKIWKNSNRYIIRIPRNIEPLVNTKAKYKVVLEEITS